MKGVGPSCAIQSTWIWGRAVPTPFKAASPAGTIFRDLLKNKLPAMLDLVAQGLDFMMKLAQSFLPILTRHFSPDGDFWSEPFLHGID
jgi:hypothetical protein